MPTQERWQCRVAPSIGELDGTPEEAWGTLPYTSDTAPTVFFGLYGLPDFYALWRHKGRKVCLWTGSDVRHFVNGYFLNDDGGIRIGSKPLALWIKENCESFVENEVERDFLQEFGIDSIVVPSFLGKVSNYPVSFTPSDKPKLYASVSGDDFELYRFKDIESLAAEFPQYEFYLYGLKSEWKTKQKNVIVRGRVPKEVFNTECKEMQAALRLLPFEGFSELVAKSLLWGQYPISAISYPHTLAPSELRRLKSKKRANVKGREWFLSVVNQYPWVRYE